MNWTISNYFFGKQEFEATESGINCDLILEFEPGSHTIEYYENNSVTPTKVKVIEI